MMPHSEGVENGGAATNSQDEIDLRRLFGNLWRARWTICAVTLAAALLAAAVSAGLPPTWEAKADLMVVTPPVQTLSAENPSARLGGDLNVVAVLRPALSPEAVAALGQLTAVLQEVAQRVGDSPDRLRRNLRARPVRNTNIVELSARASDPERAVHVAEVWATVVIEAARRPFSGEDVFGTFSQQLKAAQAALETVDLELREFNARSRISELQARAGKLTDQLATYEVRRNDLRVAVRRAEAELSKIQAELKNQARMLVLEKALADDPFLHAVVAEGSGRTAQQTAPLTLRSQEQNPVFNVLEERRALIAKEVEALRAELGGVEESMARIRGELGGSVGAGCTALGADTPEPTCRRDSAGLRGAAAAT